MSGAAALTVRRLLLWVLTLALFAGAAACGGDEASETETDVSNGETTAASDEPAASEGADQDTATTSAPTTAPTTTTTTAPPARSMGVVLLAPGEADNKLNVRAGPGTGNAVIDELTPAQTGLAPSGAIEVLDGRIWHEVDTGVVLGWVYGYYLTETWTPSEIEAEWDWNAALEDFANALVLGEGLEESVSWRGLFAIYFDQNLRRWPQEDLAGLADDGTELRWSNTGASAGEADATVGTWKEVIGDAFLSDYLDQDVQIEVGGLTLGSNSVLPDDAVSSAFANFPWVAIHDPGDDETLGGLDWSTWLVFMEMEEEGPKIVGLQPQFGYP